MSDQEPEGHPAYDPEAFSRLYDLNYARILNYILYSTGDVELARDLTSETFFKALRAVKAQKYRGGSFTAWLYRIASREIAMHHRKSGITRVVLLPFSSLSDDTGKLRDGSLDLESREAQRELERSEDFIVISRAFKKLPARQREVVFLRFFEERSIEEISRLLERPDGTVKSQIHHALKRLRSEIQPPGGDLHLNKRGLETSGSHYTLGEEVD